MSVNRLLSIGLIGLLLSSQLGLTFITHYCQGVAVESGIAWTSHDALSCGMEKEEPEAPCSSDGMELLEKHCCEDEKLTILNEEDRLSPPTLSFNLSTQSALQGVAPFQNTFPGSYDEQRPQRPPPSVAARSSTDLPVRLQVLRL